MMDLGVLMGWLTIPLFIARFTWAQSRRALMMSALPLFLLIIVSYLALHETQGAMMVGMALTSTILQIAWATRSWAHRWPGRLVRLATALILGGLGVALAPPTSWLTGLPALAYSISRIGEMQLDHHTMRRIFLVSTTLWTVYAGLSGNIPLCVMEGATLIANGRWLWRSRKILDSWQSGQMHRL